MSTRFNLSSISTLAAEFARQGFVVLRELCPPDTIEAMRSQALADLADGVGPVEYEAEVGYEGAPASLDEPGGRTVRRLLDALGRHEMYQQWALSGELTQVVRALLGAVQTHQNDAPGQAASRLLVVRAHHNCIMTKQPDFSSSTGWHQDIRYWSYARPELVNAWTALGEESSNNGGMRLIPGSHRHEFADDCFDAQRFFRTDHAPNQAWLDRAVQMDMRPGDVLFFHARLLHSAGRNLSDERKLSLVLSYRDSSNTPVPGSRSAAQSDLDSGPATRSSSAEYRNQP
ncbi:MAG: phytanoyl-CoA dioxygenase family protein [Pseudomonadota bacterium]